MTEVAGAPTHDRSDRWTAVRDRLTRLRPDLLPPTYLGWAIACWALTLAVAVAILIPGVTDAIRAEPLGQSGVVGVFQAPLALRVLVVVAAAVLAGAHVVAHAVRSRTGAARRRRDAVLREAALAAAAAAPAVLLLADRAWLFAIPAVLLFLVAELAAHRPPADPGLADLVLGLATAAPWVVLGAYQFTAAGGRGGSWVWIALFGVAAGFAAFGSYYGVARAAESRSSAFEFLFREHRPAPVVFVIALVAAVLVALRLTVLRDLFQEPDPMLWSPFDRGALSWLHAVLVAALVIAVTLRSARRPWLRVGSRGVTAALAAVGNTDLVLMVGVILVGLVAAAITGGMLLAESVFPLVPWLKVAGVAAIGIVAATPWLRGTAGRVLGLVTAAYLVPLTVQNALIASGMDPEGPVAFAGTPVQITVVLVAFALVLSAIDLARPPERRTNPSVLIRLAVVPLVAVHAGWLLPAAWSELGRVVLVLGVLLALVVLLPPVAPDRRRHALTVLSASAAQLLALTVFVLAIPSFFEDPQVVVLGLFWLTVAIVAALTIETVERPAQSVAGSRSASS